MLKFLAGMLICLLASSGYGYPPPPSPAPPPSESQLERWWEDLAKQEPKASTALLKLSSYPEQTLNLLKKKLYRLELDDKRFLKLLADLGSKDEKVARAADAEFRKYDPRLAKDIPNLFFKSMDELTTMRLVAILEDKEFGIYEKKGKPEITLQPHDSQIRITLRWPINKEEFEEVSSWIFAISPEWTVKKDWQCMQRAIALLEIFNSPEAIAILKDIAKGHKHAAPTKAAFEVLGRMKLALKD
jgi:hypothetical protein